jgi:hypothetical protein
MPTLNSLRLVGSAALLCCCLGACTSANSISGIPEPVDPTPPPPPETTAAVKPEPPPALGLAVLDGARWRTLGEHDFQLSYHFEGDHYTTSGNPVWQESGVVRLLEAEGKRLHLSFDKRVFDGKDDAHMRRWIVVADDSESFVMDGMVFVREAHAAVVAGEEFKAAQSP